MIRLGYEVVTHKPTPKDLIPKIIISESFDA